MSIKAITYYQITCDRDGCTTNTADYGEYSAWDDAGSAEEDWTNSDAQVAGDKYYCREHRMPQCCSCESVTDIAEDEPDGDPYCPKCMPTTPPADLARGTNDEETK